MGEEDTQKGCPSRTLKLPSSQTTKRDTSRWSMRCRCKGAEEHSPLRQIAAKWRSASSSSRRSGGDEDPGEEDPINNEGNSSKMKLVESSRVIRQRRRLIPSSSSPISNALPTEVEVIEVKETVPGERATSPPAAVTVVEEPTTTPEPTMAPEPTNAVVEDVPSSNPTIAATSSKKSLIPLRIIGTSLML